MSKKIIGYGIGVILFLFLWSPWWVPDSWMLVKKGTPDQYVPLWNAWAYTSIVLLFSFAVIGIVSLAEWINAWITKD